MIIRIVLYEEGPQTVSSKSVLDVTVQICK